MLTMLHKAQQQEVVNMGKKKDIEKILERCPPKPAKKRSKRKARKLLKRMSYYDVKMLRIDTKKRPMKRKSFWKAIKRAHDTRDRFFAPQII